MSRRTALYRCHVERGARMVDFAGWEMPVQYGGIIREHEACRRGAVVFDTCHMGEIEVRASDVRAALNMTLSNDLSNAPEGSARYGFILNDDGGVIDDVITFIFDASRAMIVTNAANTDRDFAWLVDHCPALCEVRDLSEGLAKIDLQGPRSRDVLGRVLDSDLGSLGYFRLTETSWRGAPLVVSRTGYTGELGYELFVEVERAAELWCALLDGGVVAAGLGARDTLRLEAGLPLYGHELDENTTPAEAALARYVGQAKREDFPGKSALRRKGPPTRSLVGLAMVERGVPRAGCELAEDGRAVGVVTSGTISPTLKKGIAMAYVETGAATLGRRLDLMIRGRPVPCSVVEMPFYEPEDSNRRLTQMNAG